MLSPDAPSSRSKPGPAGPDAPLAPHAPAGMNGTHASPLLPAQGAAATAPPDPAAGDWAHLLGSVTARLKLLGGERRMAAPPEPVRDPAGRLRAGVLECADALEQVHALAAGELARCRHLEREVFHARAALAQAHAELAGTQAGEKHALHLALHDSLTGLPNRRFFLERLGASLGAAQAEAGAPAVIYLDLDDFKGINDTHGHSIGDELLRIVAARLARAVRTEDMVSRLSGDEFACLLAEAPPRDHLARLACKLFDTVSAPLQIGPLKLTVRPSIGMAIWPAGGATAAALLASADTAMYRAKRQHDGYAFA
jgi:diguanylate cyclase (GGDEF)-like protein